MTRIQQPSARYILPEFRERTANGERIMNPYAKLFEERIIFLGVQIDDASADDVMAQLLTLWSRWTRIARSRSTSTHPVAPTPP